MKMLDYYDNLGLNSSDEIFKYLLNGLKDSIYTWDYFTDFNKCISNVKQFDKELHQLSELLNVDEEQIDNKLLEIIRNNYKVKKALLLLIALRIDKLKDTAIVEDVQTLESNSKYNLFQTKDDLSESQEQEIIEFFYCTGLRRFFLEQEISNLFDYCKGIEVGLDTHARKNRTGDSMETICKVYIDELCNKHGYSYIEQATYDKVKELFGREIKLEVIDRRFDFAIDTNKKLYLFEVNFYSRGGSKLKATAGEYKELNDLLTKQGIEFVWITDGVGWNTSKTALRETFDHNDYIFNLQMLKNNILEEIVK